MPILAVSSIIFSVIFVCPVLHTPSDPRFRWKRFHDPWSCLIVPPVSAGDMPVERKEEENFFCASLDVQLNMGKGN